jgi:hypothetical protein
MTRSGLRLDSVSADILGMLAQPGHGLAGNETGPRGPMGKPGPGRSHLQQECGLLVIALSSPQRFDSEVYKPPPLRTPKQENTIVQHFASS